MWLLLPRANGDWRTAGNRPSEQRVAYSDGHEFVARDRKGRVTRHIVCRAGRPYVDNCYKFVRKGGKVRRVKITAEEWERLHDGAPRPPKQSETFDATPPQRHGNAADVDENDWNID